jgi:hypothetical protein
MGLVSRFRLNEIISSYVSVVAIHHFTALVLLLEHQHLLQEHQHLLQQLPLEAVHQDHVHLAFAVQERECKS